MPIVNGIDFANIVSISGVDSSAITNICGVPISNAPACVIVEFGYSDGIGQPPETSCFAQFIEYDFDESTGTLYLATQCGQPDSIAPIGFYSNGFNIQYWNGDKFLPYGRCKR